MLLPLALDPRARIYRALLRRNGAPEFDYYRVEPRERPYPLAVALPRARVALVTTAGLFHRPTQPAFVAANPLGDPSYRWIRRGLSRSEIGISPGRFDTRDAERDLEVVHPEARLSELEAKGTIGSLHEQGLSFFGHVLCAARVARVTGPNAARLLREEGVHAAIVIAACVLGCQTAAIVASCLEAEGIASVVLAPWASLAQAVGAPRVVSARWDFGRPAGPPNDVVRQSRRLKSALDLLG